MELVGYRHIEGKAKKTGRPYSANLLFVKYESTSDDVVGMEVDTVFVPDEVLNLNLVVGMEFEVMYNKNGFAIDVVEIS